MININDVKSFKINESDVLTESDRKHIENYKQLIKFFESALQQSIATNETNYKVLHSSYVQSIRYLDSLILSYDNAIQSARLVNDTIDKISDINLQKLENEGNEK